MYTMKNGYVAGAVLMLPFAKKVREHVEYEKFLCRMMIDNDVTKEFKNKTANLKDQLYALKYNGKGAIRLTAEWRNKDGNQSN